MNRVLLIGRLGARPETKTLANGRLIARFCMAVTEYYKNERGQRINETHWHKLVAWDKTADIASQFLDKGKEVAVEGRLLSRHYVDKEGRKQYVTEVLVNDLLMIIPKIL